MKKFLILTALIVTLTTPMIASNAFFDQGKSGVLATFGYGFTSRSNSFPVNLAYSWNGVLEVGALYRDMTQYSFSVRAFSINPFISYSIIKQNPANPVSVDLSISYDNMSYPNSISAATSIWNVGATVSRKMPINSISSFVLEGVFVNSSRRDTGTNYLVNYNYSTFTLAGSYLHSLSSDWTLVAQAGVYATSFIAGGTDFTLGVINQL